MQDTIYNKFNSSACANSQKFPKGGYSYLFEWSKEKNRKKWKSDGYKWGKKRYVKKISDTITKSCYYVYTKDNYCSKIFVRQVYYNSKFPQKAVICYKGDCRKALFYAKSNNIEGSVNKTLFIKNLPANTIESSILGLHNSISRIKLEAYKDQTNTKYALVAFDDEESAIEMKEELNQVVFNGNVISADFLYQNLPISCIQDSTSLTSTQDPCTLFITGFDSQVTRNSITKLFDTCASIRFEGGHTDQNLTMENANSEEHPFRYCYVRYSRAEEAERVHDLQQDLNNMVVMFARKEA